MSLVRDPLTGEMVSLSNARQTRPLTGAKTAACPFCPGADSEVGPGPFWVAVLDNRFPVFRRPGEARVVVYSPHHADDLAWMTAAHRVLVWQAWQDQSRDLRSREDIDTVFVFENRGPKVGATIAHPHGQIYGYPYRPPRMVAEWPAFLSARCPVCSGLLARDRVLARGPGWTALTAPAMRLPYEVWMLPSRHVSRIEDLTTTEVQEGARLMQSVLRTYDHLFGRHAALVMGLYQAPRGTGDRYHLRWSFMPIERGGGRLKYIAGSELGMGAFVTDVSWERAHERLRAFWCAVEEEGGPERDV